MGESGPLLRHNMRMIVNKTIGPISPRHTAGPDGRPDPMENQAIDRFR